MTALTHSRVIARHELRRRWRAMKANTGQLLGIALAALFLLPVSLGGLVGAYFAGTAVADGSVQTPLQWARMGAVYLWLSIAGFGGYRAYATALRPDNLDGFLTTVSHRTVLGGLVLAELSMWSVVTALFGGGLAVAFGLGAGSLLSIPLVVLSLVLVLATGLATGFGLALAVRNTGVRSVLLTRLRTVFLGILAVGYFGLIFTNSFASVLEPLYRLLAPTPVAWFGDLALAGLAADVSALRAGGAVVLTGLYAAVGVPVLARLAEWLWYADGVHVEHTVEHTDDGESRLAGILPRPLLGVVAADWKRARRSPLTLSFAVYPLFVLVNPVINAVETGTVGTGFPIWVLVCGAWITGALFALNVLGHEGAVLPATLLAADPGRSLVVGHVLAGVAVALPATVVATLATGLASPHSIAMVASLVVSAIVLSIASGAIATGIGVAFPRFEAVNVSRSTKAVVPSLIAFTIYSFVVLGVSLPTMLAHSGIAGHAIASFTGLDQVVVAATGTGLSATLAVGVGIVSSYAAIHRVEAYRTS